MDKKRARSRSPRNREDQQNQLQHWALEQFAQALRNRRFRKIAVITGAGISTAAGIPDFRSQTGLFKTLKARGLPDPEFSLSLPELRDNPSCFFSIIKDIYKENLIPTDAHYFLSLLESKKQLLHVYTQNIDGLEQKASISQKLISQLHGSFDSSHCIDWKSPYDQTQMSIHIQQGTIARCQKCQGIAKPDIVLYEESVPKSILRQNRKIQNADWLLVMGTSMSVRTVTSLLYTAQKSGIPIYWMDLNLPALWVGAKFLQGDIENTCRKIVTAAGWEKEFMSIKLGKQVDKEMESIIQGLRYLKHDEKVA